MRINPSSVGQGVVCGLFPCFRVCAKTMCHVQIEQYVISLLAFRTIMIYTKIGKREKRSQAITPGQGSGTPDKVNLKRI